MFAADMQKDPDRVIDLFVEFLEPHFEASGRLSSVQAQQLLRKLYQLRYGFTSEATLTQRPASLVAFHSAEDPYRGSTMEDHMVDFTELRIGEHFNVSFDQYLARPRHEVVMMKRVAANIQKRKNTAGANAVSQAEKMAKELGLSN